MVGWAGNTKTYLSCMNMSLKATQVTSKKNQANVSSTENDSDQKREPELTRTNTKNLGNKAAYRDFVTRDGPRALGSRDIPQVCIPLINKINSFIFIYSKHLRIILIYLHFTGARELSFGIGFCDYWGIRYNGKRNRGRINSKLRW